MGSVVYLKFSVEQDQVREMRGNVFTGYFKDIMWNVAQKEPAIIAWFKTTYPTIQNELLLKASVQGLPRKVLGLPYPKAYENWIDANGSPIEKTVKEIVNLDDDEKLEIDAALLEEIFVAARVESPLWEAVPVKDQFPASGKVIIQWEE